MRRISGPFSPQLAPSWLAVLATLALVKKCRHRIDAGAGGCPRGGAHRASRRRDATVLGRLLVSAGAAFIATSGQGVLAQAAPQAGFEPDAALIEEALTLARQSAASLAPVGARIVASAGPLDARLRLAPCARVEPFLAAGLPTWGTTRVGLRCVSGRVRWRAFLPVQVQVLAPAWTSKAALPSGALVASEQWELAETDWAAAPSPPLGALAAIAGRTLARPVSPGQALREADLQARRWFANGQAVRIVASGPGFNVQADGLALGHGIEGQPVRVRTEGGRILTGQAVGEALVEVRP
ncbi:MAG: flagellar basal body P-ring formation protein FlgA [Rubrivivax sp.]|nr:flagellar basal body P-ring formation protein FlgA [Rubrivivax sp.]